MIEKKWQSKTMEHFEKFGAMSLNGFKGPLLKLFHHNMGTCNLFILTFYHQKIMVFSSHSNEVVND